MLFGDSKSRTSGNAQLDAARLDTTRRRDFKEDDATVPVALGLRVALSVAWCFAMDACRSVSLMRFDATGRVTSQALVNLHGGRLYWSQDASSRLLRSFIGVFAVHTFDPRQRVHTKIGRDD